MFEGDEEVEHEYTQYYNVGGGVKLLKWRQKASTARLQEKLKNAKPRLGRVITAEELFNELARRKTRNPLWQVKPSFVNC